MTDASEAISVSFIGTDFINFSDRKKLQILPGDAALPRQMQFGVSWVGIQSKKRGRITGYSTTLHQLKETLT
jgi:hypothetical protein